MMADPRMNQAVSTKADTLLDQSGRLSGQAADLYEQLVRIEQHLIGGQPRESGGKMAGATDAPMLTVQLRETSNTLSNCLEVANRIKNGIGI